MSARQVDADLVLLAVARLVAAGEYSAEIMDQPSLPGRTELITAAGGEIARAELALADLLAPGTDYDRHREVLRLLDAARAEARMQAVVDATGLQARSP